MSRSESRLEYTADLKKVLSVLKVQYTVREVPIVNHFEGSASNGSWAKNFFLKLFSESVAGYRLWRQQVSSNSSPQHWFHNALTSPPLQKEPVQPVRETILTQVALISYQILYICYVMYLKN